jgi:signal transduction histidine kinase
VTHRILLALLALTTVVLAAAVFPLGLQAVAHERDSFVNSAEATAHSISVIAADRFANPSSRALTGAVHNAAKQGDEVLVLDSNGRPVAEIGVPHDKYSALTAEANASGSQISEMTKDRVIVVEPIWDNDHFKGTTIGTVVLERPVDSLNQAVTDLWLYVALLAGGAEIAAALIAVTFARWVNKPLSRMDTAARQLADGDLAVRAATGIGPPELRRMAATFNMMAGRLETLVHGHRVMLADVAHQLRTPLAALRLRIDLLAADSGPDAAADLAGAQEEIVRLSRLVDGLLAVARAESVSEQVVNINLMPAIAERVAAWQPVADGHGVKLLTQFDDNASSAMVALGVGHLEQILDNLLANAIDAVHEDGTVTVSLAASGHGTTLTVADNGPGMSPEDRSRAFLRFVSGNKDGTGLGLAIVHRIVTSNGGTARLAETPGGGLTVVLDFPGTALYEGTNKPR